MITYGDYIEYRKLSSTIEVLNWLKDSNIIYSNNNNFKENIEILCNYKDSVKRDYGKDKEKKLYTNIYAHHLTLMLPLFLTTDDKINLVKEFMIAIDSCFKHSNFIYCYKFEDFGKGNYANIIIFTRKIFKRKKKRLVVWDSNYYWNPITKRRCKASDNNAVLLHKENEPKLDENGNKQYIDYYCSPKENKIFKYTTFSGMIKRLKNCFQYAKMICSRNLSRLRTIGYITVKENISVLSKRKISLRNQTIKRINILISGLYSYFDDKQNLIDYTIFNQEERFLKKEFYRLIHNIDLILHTTTWKDPVTGYDMNLGVKQSFLSLKDNLALVEDYIYQKLYNWWDTHILEIN